MKMKSKISIETVALNGATYFQFVDHSGEWLSNKRIFRTLERYKSYFLNFDEFILKNNLSYIHLDELLSKISLQLNKLGANELEIHAEVSQFIKNNRYAINEQRVAGETIKIKDERWRAELDEFKDVIDAEISRPLKEEQLHASFYLATMKRAANFSVPGAGKTAMMYGAFAYLSSLVNAKVDKILVVCPLNAFEAWRSEFVEVFGHKRSLVFLNLKDGRYKDIGAIRTDWGRSNVAVINYEALEGKLTVLNNLINDKTMLVFDEVHRIKNPQGNRARAALSLGMESKYRYVLTGTPIPNTYKDIYNFLNLLYYDEYETYFGWDVNDLDSVNVQEVNDRIYPFFWRTNKRDLNVPAAEDDLLFIEPPTPEQMELVKTIYECETNVLSLYIRLLQASTNPTLLNSKIDYSELGYVDEEITYSYFESLDDEERRKAKLKRYAELNLKEIRSSKFERGIELVLDLVKQGKKVLVWAIFVGTMQKIERRLHQHGVSINLIYGATPKETRVNLINEFRDGDVDVLVSNPATLGESISLHQTVHDAIYFEYDFNLTFMLQSRDRIHRLGLKETDCTRYYYLMTEGNRAHASYIDRQVYSRLKDKEAVMLDAIEGNLLKPQIMDSYLEDVKRVINS